MALEAIIFDMDGVLVDSEQHWKGIESSFLKRLVPSWNDELQQSIIGMSMFDVYKRLQAEHGLDISLEDYVAFYDGLGDEIYGVRSNAVPGIMELVQRAASWVPKLGVCSSSPRRWINIVLERFELGSCFSAIASAEEIDGLGKPAPDIYLLAAERLQVHPSRALAVEDSWRGIASAKAAGMKCLGLRNGFNDHQDLSQADEVVTGAQEVTLELIQSVTSSSSDHA